MGIEFSVPFPQSINKALCVLFEFGVFEFIACFIGRFHLSTFDGLVWNFVKIACHLDERKPANPPLGGVPVVPLVPIAIVGLEGVVEVVVTLSVGEQRKQG